MAFNLVSNVTRYVSLEVSCPLQNLRVTAKTSLSSSDSSLNQVTSVVVDKPLTLNVSLEEGSFAVYNISWGDGQLAQVNQSSSIDPTSFQQTHSYTESGNYTVMVMVFNKVSKIQSVLRVRVTRCSNPAVRLEYGSHAHPMSRKLGSDVPITAHLDWNTEAGCESVNSGLELLNWITAHDSKRTISQISGFSPGDNIVEYVLRKENLFSGTYKIILVTKLNGIAQNHTAFVEIVRSPLNAYIVGGLSKTIPYEVNITNELTSKSERVKNNITLDASESNDPDVPDNGEQGLIFTWSCRVDNASVDRTSCASVGCKCLNLSFVSLDAGDTPQVVLSAHHFIIGLQYEFRVLVKKDERSAEYKQQVNLVYGNPPDITLR